MTKYDRNFCKPDENLRPLYCPLPLAVVIHHHDESVDPETGEHWERDWDTSETKTNPTAADYAQMGYLPVVETTPADPAPSPPLKSPPTTQSTRRGSDCRNTHERTYTQCATGNQTSIPSTNAWTA